MRILPVYVFVGIFVLIVLSTQKAQAQAGTALTIGVVRLLLVDTLVQLQNVVETAGAEVKGVGNSLQASAQNVIKDIDSVFGSNLDLTFQNMDAMQRSLFRDAQILASQLERASITIAKVGGTEARRAISEADITAYNTSYSLPCRSQIPRFVYSLPEKLRAGSDTRSVTIKGNFLDIGPEPEITVESRPVKIVARNANQIRVEIPEELIEDVSTNREISIGARLYSREKTLFCNYREVLSENSSSASVILLPSRIVSVEGWIQPVIPPKNHWTNK